MGREGRVSKRWEESESQGRDERSGKGKEGMGVGGVGRASKRWEEWESQGRDERSGKGEEEMGGVGIVRKLWIEWEW